MLASNQANSTWDQRQRLTSLQLVGGSTQTYTYDPENHRLSKTYNGQTTSHVQNPHGTSGLSETLIESRPRFRRYTIRILVSASSRVRKRCGSHRRAGGGVVKRD